MSDVYAQLAKKLDKIPNGYPSTESGVELKILRKIFPPEDAAMALKLKPLPQTAEVIAKRLKKPVEEMRKILDDMADKGQIGSMKLEGKQCYMLMPLVVGFFEFQLDRLDRELVDLVEEYLPAHNRVSGGHKPALARVVPVNKSIEAEPRILLYEDMHRIIKEAKSFRLMDCICRKKADIKGEPCKHEMNACLMFSKEPNAFDYFAHSGRKITRQEAFDVLEQCEKDGLVHATYNVRNDNLFVCNCCSCCCEFLKSITVHKVPYILTSSNFLADINEETCKACGVCADKRCPVTAIARDNGFYKVQIERCIGCGVCVITCPTESIKMIRKPKALQDKPPSSLKTWFLKRKFNRAIDNMFGRSASK